MSYPGPEDGTKPAGAAEPTYRVVFHELPAVPGGETVKVAVTPDGRNAIFMREPSFRHETEQVPMALIEQLSANPSLLSELSLLEAREKLFGAGDHQFLELAMVTIVDALINGDLTPKTLLHSASV